LMLAQRGRNLLLSVLGVGFGWVLLMPSLQVVEPSALWNQLIAFHLSDGGSLSLRLAWLFRVFIVWFVLWFGFKGRNTPIPGLKMACLLGVLVHLAPAELHVEHVVVLVPAMALLLASGWSERLASPKVIALGVAATLIGVGSSLQYVHLDTGESTVEQNMEIGRWLQSHVPEGQAILTRQVALAVEADRDVVSGCEMGRFGDLDGAAVLGSLAVGVGGVAVTPADFEPALRREIATWSEVHLEHRRVEEPYGQFDERLWVWAGASIWMR